MNSYKQQLELPPLLRNIALFCVAPYRPQPLHELNLHRF